MSATILIGFEQRNRLDRQHREYAGHQVQDQAAEKRENQAGEKAQGAGIGRSCVCAVGHSLACFTVAVDRGLDRRDAARCGADAICVGRFAIVDHQHAFDRLRRLDEIIAERLAPAQGVAAIAGKALRRRVVDQVVGERKEIDLGVGGDGDAVHGDRDVRVAHREPGGPVHVDRQLRAGLCEERSPDWIGCIGVRMGWHFQRQFGIAGDADVAAHQPAGAGLKFHRLAGRPVRRQPDRDQVQGFAAVTVVGQLAERFTVRIGPVNLAGGHALRQGPLQTRCQAGVTGVTPVGVPFGIGPQPQRHPELRTALGSSLGRIDLRDQFGFDMVEKYRRCQGRRAGQRQHGNGQCAEQARERSHVRASSRMHQ